MCVSKASFGTFLAVCVRSVQQNDQIPRHQPLPLHGHDVHHLSAEGGLWLQGQHRVAGEEMPVSTLFYKTPPWYFQHFWGGTFALWAVLTEILLWFCSTAGQEGKQRGDELGPWSDLWLLQKPQHPLKTARCRCSQHRERRPFTVEPSVQPLLFTDKPDLPLGPTSNHLSPCFPEPSAPCQHSKNSRKIKSLYFL